MNSIYIVSTMHQAVENSIDHLYDFTIRGMFSTLERAEELERKLIATGTSPECIGINESVLDIEIYADSIEELLDESVRTLDTQLECVVTLKLDGCDALGHKL